MGADTSLARTALSGQWQSWLVRTTLIAVLLAGVLKYVRSTILLQQGEVPGDLAVFYITGLAVRQGIGLYDPAAQQQLAIQIVGPERVNWYRVPLDSNTHPPSEVWLPVLISFLPWPQAGDIWRAILHLSFLAAIVWILYDLRRQGASNERLMLAAVVAVWLIPVQTSVDFGQMDVPLLLLLLLARELYRRGRPAWSGAALGVAASLKPSPAILLVFFLVRKDWKVIAGAAGAALVHVVISSVVLGPQVWLDWMFRVLPQLLGGSTNYANQTFNGLAYHLFADAPLFFSLDPPPSLPSARILAVVLNLSFLVMAICLTRQYAARGRGVEFDLGLGFFVLTMLVTSSISWEHYYTWALMPLATLLAPGAVRLQGRWVWFWVVVGLAAYALIIVTPRFHVFSPETYSWLWALRFLIPLKVYGSIALAALLARALARDHE